MKAIIPTLSVIILGNAIFGFMALAGIAPYSFFAENAVANSVTGLSQVIFSILLLGVFFFAILYKTPADLDYEKKQEICALRLEIEKANERIKVNVFLEKYQQNGHASLLVHNNEVKELSECYATLDVLEHESIFDKNLLIELNPNGKWLSWGGGSKDEKVTIPGESKLAVINISNDMGINDSLKFLFYGHEPETELTGYFNVIVRLHGKINNEEFEPVKFIGCIEFTKSLIGEDVITGLLIKNESCDQPAA